jgi:hypothetical protein
MLCSGVLHRLRQPLGVTAGPYFADGSVPRKPPGERLPASYIRPYTTILRPYFLDSGPRSGLAAEDGQDEARYPPQNPRPVSVFVQVWILFCMARFAIQCYAFPHGNNEHFTS